jgi:hypothetical protein
MLRRPLLFDLVHVTFTHPEQCRTVDAPGLVEYVCADGWYEVLFLDNSGYGFPGQYLRVISLNELSLVQVEAARRLQVELAERFVYEVTTGHLVRDRQEMLLVLGEEVRLGQFHALELKSKTEYLVNVADCTRVLPFDLPFAERLEFEVLSQWLDHEAAIFDLANDLWRKGIKALGDPDGVGEGEWERAKGQMEHRLYARFPEFAKRQFLAQQEIDRKYALVEGRLYFLEDFEDKA